MIAAALKSLNDLLGAYQHLVEVVIALFWAIYVFYTIRTFREIRRQTELQSEAFLVVSSSLVPTDKAGSPKPTPQLDNLYDKWFGIIATNVPAAQQQERVLRLRLQNRGRSDITWWRVSVDARVEPEDYLARKFNIVGESSRWIIEYEGFKDVVAADGELTIPIARTGPFPRVAFRWEVEYRDMRDVSYRRFGGDKQLVDRNVLASPKAPPEIPHALHDPDPDRRQGA
jgi:hypothetical protein